MYYRTKKNNEMKFMLDAASSVGVSVDGVEYELSKTLDGELMLSMNDRKKFILIKPLGPETIIVSAS